MSQPLPFWLLELQDLYLVIYDLFLLLCIFRFLSASVILSFPGGSDGKESACNTGGLTSIPGLGRSLGEGNGYPLQYSRLQNPMDRGTWWAVVVESDMTERSRFLQSKLLLPPSSRRVVIMFRSYQNYPGQAPCVNILNLITHNVPFGNIHRS